ncbi:MAG: Gfo/Idh/MocA family protein [Armatimonadota bacterium]
MQKVRVGFIGAGNRANASHYPSVADLPDLAEMVAICDLDEQKLHATADRWGIGARFTDLFEMLDAVELDAVYCIAPPSALPAMVMPCLEAGKHVFTEKPLGTGFEDARAMAEFAEARNCLTMVAFNRRFAPVNLRCMEMIDERGGPTQVMVEYHKTQAEKVPYPNLSMMVYDISHAVDATRWWLGEPRAVYATARRAYQDVDNVFNALMTYEGDAIGILTANRDSGTRYERVEVHAHGMLCVIFAPDYAEIWIDGAKEPEVITGEDLAGTDDPRVTYGFLAENRHFLQSVQAGAQPQPSFADAARTMRAA